jgi:hydrogenase nickel incorporation protein HypB
MCEDCGCAIANVDAEPAPLLHTHPHAAAGAASRATVESVSVFRNLLSENDRIAAHNREHFDSYGLLAVNLMSSPGAGKTALLERTIEAAGHRLRIAVIEGDLATENDARRIRAKGVPAVQITTGSACHLDARMVHRALHEIELEGIDLLFIENVGNLVCPASFDLGQHLDVALLSVPEGDDKPQKYPVMFRATDLMLLTKADLLPLLPEFDPARAEASLRAVGSDVPVMPISSRSGFGLDAWCDWLDAELARRRERPAAGQTGDTAHDPATAMDSVAG